MPSSTYTPPCSSNALVHSTKAFSRFSFLKDSIFGSHAATKNLHSSKVRTLVERRGKVGQDCSDIFEKQSFWAMPGIQEEATRSEDLSDEKIDISSFLAGLMPKKEIGADKFLEAYPLYDGRGIVIAILDSGVDPAAAGLQVTSDGKPKILDILDCTGSGDIETSTTVKADEKGYIVGASGARLQINKSWKNPSNDWRVGCKFVYELFTESLTSRIKKERKKKWDEQQRGVITDALRSLASFDLKYPQPSDATLKKQREELQNRIDILQKLNESYEDKGPIIDAVVWHDGNSWRAALDTQDMEDNSGLGKLADFTPLTNYRNELKYGTFTRLDACTFVANIYDDGNVLSIVTDSSPHGTHVAGITAAHHPEEPLLNGIAPGAQLVSCKVGDSRLSSMETGTGLTRALIAVIENKCNLINLSYGEPTSVPDYGRFIELADEVVNKYGVIFVSSAGNSGPALSTVGAPGGTSSSIIGIGAYVSPEMAATAHSMVEPPTEGLHYTWSSRGPTADGDLGVYLSASGGAVAPVPTWTLQRRMLMNGTSMASPCACGGVALVLSAVKAKTWSMDPYLVRKALENTAAPVSSNPEEVLTTGRGLLQLTKALEYLGRCKDRPPVSYSVQLNRASNIGFTARGVYLRELYDCQQASEWTVKVMPKFQEDTDKLDVLVPFEEHIQLEASGAAWVKCPKYLLLTHNGRTFNIMVDPTDLRPGIHFTEVLGLDCDAPWRGPLFRVPITVTKPMEISVRPPVASFSGLSFSPGHIERRFIAVPEGSTWVEASFRVTGFDTPRKFFLNAVQLLPRARPYVWESIMTFSSPSSKSFAFAVKGGLTMEVTIALFWSSGSGSHLPATAEVEMEFHGIMADKDLFIEAGELATRVQVKAPLSMEVLSPKVTLTKIRTPYRPVDTKLVPLSPDRDKLPNGRQIHALTLTYKFTLTEAGRVTPRFPYLNKRIYDNEFESQFYMIADPNKRVVAKGDVYPKGVRLCKGDYAVRLYIRHDNVAYLEKLRKSVLFVDRVFDEKNFVKLSCYSSIDGPITGLENLKTTILAPRELRPFYIAAPGDDKLPKDAAMGSVLLGKIAYGKLSQANSKKDLNGVACPASSRVTYFVPPPIKAEEKSKEKEAEGKKDALQKIAEEVRDVKIKLLSLLPRSTEEEKKEWYEQAKTLKAEYPSHLQLMVEILQKVAASQDEERNYNEIIEAADNVIKLVNRDELARFFSMKSESEETDANRIKKDMETQRDALADAFYKKGLALIGAERASPGSNSEAELSILSLNGVEPNQKSYEAATETDERRLPEEKYGKNHGAANLPKDEFGETFAELRKLVDTTSPKYSLLTIQRERRLGRLGTAIKVLTDTVQEDGKLPPKSLYELRIELLKEIGWTHWAQYEQNWLSVRFPAALPLF